MRILQEEPMTRSTIKAKIFSFALVFTIASLPITTLAQTRVSMPKNKYKIEEDVKLGRDTSAQVEQQFPILNDAQATQYVQRVGANLVNSIPGQFRQPAFTYNFQVVNASDINAFALPGGPMYVNRGMIEAAENEGEMAGVMAHEIAHIALRHGTAQATKQGSVGNQLGTIGLILGGLIVGGQAGAQAGAIAAMAWQTKYSREYETQADILGAQIMADAGYDPRDLANMFQTIANEGGGRGPEWLSSHPDPGNRFQKINQEASRLNVRPKPIKITRDFERIQARLRGMPPARTMAEIQKSSQSGQNQGQNPMTGGTYSNSVPVPSTRTRNYSSGNWVSLNVPSNWREFPTQSDVTFAPQGAFGDQGITHGIMIGINRGQGNNLSRDTQAFVDGLIQSNNYLNRQTGYLNARFAGRQGMNITLSGRSPINRRNETVKVYTAKLSNGDLFYLITVAPQNELAQYDRAFRNVLNSIRLNDRSM